MRALTLVLILGRSTFGEIPCGPAEAPNHRLAGTSCAVAMRAANCAAAAAADPALRENYRDCAREQTWRFTTDTLLGCGEGAGAGALSGLKALVDGVASFYTHFANDAAARERAIDACFTAPECRDAVAGQIPKTFATREVFAADWRRTERARTTDRLDLQRRAIDLQREALIRGARPGTPAYDALLAAAAPEVAGYQRKVARDAAPTHPPLLELARAKARQLYLHSQCLDQRTATELICYSVLAIVAPGAAAAYLGKATRLARLLKTKSVTPNAAGAAGMKAAPVAEVPKSAPISTTPKSAPTPALVAKDIFVHPPGSKPLGDLRPAEVKAIQNKVDEANIEVYIVGSAAKGKRRNVDTELPLANFGESKKMTKSDIDYVVRDGRDDLASELGLPDMDASFGVRGVDSINLKNSPAIQFRPHQPPVFIDGSGRLALPR